VNTWASLPGCHIQSLCRDRARSSFPKAIRLPGRIDDTPEPFAGSRRLIGGSDGHQDWIFKPIRIIIFPNRCSLASRGCLMAINDRIRQLRQERRWTQAKLGEKVVVHQKQVSACARSRCALNRSAHQIGRGIVVRPWINWPLKIEARAPKYSGSGPFAALSSTRRSFRAG
jgi:hypothetical protein